MNMKIATQKICRPFDINVSTKLNKVLLNPIKASKEKQYMNEKENSNNNNFIPLKHSKTFSYMISTPTKRKINNVLNSPFEK